LFFRAWATCITLSRISPIRGSRNRVKLVWMRSSTKGSLISAPPRSSGHKQKETESQHPCHRAVLPD
jgi:hypothetical protein